MPTAVAAAQFAPPPPPKEPSQPEQPSSVSAPLKQSLPDEVKASAIPAPDKAKGPAATPPQARDQKIAAPKVAVPPPAPPVAEITNGGSPAVVTEPVSADLARALLGRHPSRSAPTQPAPAAPKVEGPANGQGHAARVEQATPPAQNGVAKATAVPVPSLPPGVGDPNPSSDDAAEAAKKEADSSKAEPPVRGK